MSRVVIGVPIVTKILSGAYHNGYVLNAKYDGLSLKSSAKVDNVAGTTGMTGASGVPGAQGGTGGLGGMGRAGVTVAFIANVSNGGHISGSAGGGGGAGGESDAGYTGGTGGAGGIGGAGLRQAGGSATNTGGIYGGAGGAGGSGGPGGSYFDFFGLGATGGAGGAALVLTKQGSISQTNGTMTGGAGGAGGTNGGAGGAGGSGVELSQVGAVSQSGGVMTGGAGGAGGVGVLGYGNGGYGGAGGAGIKLDAGGTVLRTGGSITGGAGGADGTPEAGTGAAGAGGAGIELAGAGTITNQAGAIAGGSGGAGQGAYNADQPTGGVGGKGGTGVELQSGGLVSNLATISGGRGGDGGFGYAGGAGGDGGLGVLLAGGGTLINTGEVTGGLGGAGGPGSYSPAGADGAVGAGVALLAGGSVVNGAAAAPSALISGGVGVYANATGAATVTNFGTIAGAGGMAVDFRSASDRLIVEAGGMFVGAVAGGGGTLELAGGMGTLTGLGGMGVISGAASATFTNFGSYVVDAGASWRLGGTSALLVDKRLTNAGTVVVAGTLVDQGVLANTGQITIVDAATLQGQGTITNSGTIALLSAGSPADLRILAKGLTLAGGGTVTLGGPVSRILGITAAATLTNVDNTITGMGFVGLHQMTLINQKAGVIDASVVGSLRLNTKGSTLVNAGLLESTATGAFLMLIASTVDQSGGGTIVATAGHVDLQNATVIGGMLETSGAGLITVNNGASTLDGGAGAVSVAGVVQVLAGTSLIVDGAISNSGKINLYGGKFVVGAAGVTLSGKGQVNLNSNVANMIIGASATATLNNVDDHIGGSGQLGAGKLTLINQAAGVIFNSQSQTLTIDTGANAVANAGTIAANGGSGILVKSAINNTGVLGAINSKLILAGAITGSGVAHINGGTLDVVTTSFTQNVAFTGATGVLELASSQTYTGSVSGLSLSGSSSLDLVDIAFSAVKTKATFAGTTASGVLTVTDGTHTSKISLLGNYTKSAWVLKSDGHGGTSVHDPAPTTTAAFTQAAAGWAGRSVAGSYIAREPPRRALSPLAGPGRA